LANLPWVVDEPSVRDGIGFGSLPVRIVPRKLWDERVDLDRHLR